MSDTKIVCISLLCFKALELCEDPYIYNPHSDTCFRLVSEPKSRSDAKKHCEDNNEHLVTLPTAESSRWLREKAGEMGSSGDPSKCKLYHYLFVSFHLMCSAK